MDNRSTVGDLIVRVLADGGVLYTTQLVKLIYLIDYLYFCQEGRTATGLKYIWDEYGPNATGHQIVKEAAGLEEAGVIEIRSAPGGDRARGHQLVEGVRPTFDPVLEAVIDDVLWKYGPLGFRELVEASKQTAPFDAARPGRPLVMVRTERAVAGVTTDDWRRHKQERAAHEGKTIGELKEKYGID